MPEGDTIFRTARSLGRALAGKPVTVFRSTYPLLTRFNDDTPLAGQTGGASRGTRQMAADSFFRRRNAGHAHADERQLAHLPPWRALAAAAIQHAHRDREQRLCQPWDSACRWRRCTRRNRSDATNRIPRPEIDVLSPDFNALRSVDRVRAHRHEEIADVLLHQEVLAGVGNVFKSEICFVTGINPFCKVSALSAGAVAGRSCRGAKAGRRQCA